jgi:hypothetical protein
MNQVFMGYLLIGCCRCCTLTAQLDHPPSQDFAACRNLAVKAAALPPQEGASRIAPK